MAVLAFQSVADVVSVLGTAGASQILDNTLCGIPHRSWPDSVGTPVGVQQKLMRHAGIRTTMNVYGDAATDEMTQAHSKAVGLALNRAQTERKAS